MSHTLPVDSKGAATDEQIMDIYMEAAAMKSTPKQFLDSLKSALYQRLAAETVNVFPFATASGPIQAIRLDKLKAIMEVKES